jgi:hypothetical protein
MALGDDVSVHEAERHLGRTGVDLTTTATLLSSRGRASILASFERPESQGWRVTAPGLTLALPHPAFTSWRQPSALQVVEDGIERVEHFDPCDAYRLMVEAVSARAADTDGWVLPLATSLAVARAVGLVARTAERTVPARP